MLEYLSPLASLYKLLTDSLKDASKSAKVSRSMVVKRRIIEIQLALEGILDNARNILAGLKQYSLRRPSKVRDVEDLKSLFRKQRECLSNFLDLFRCNASDEILKLFAPDVRRKIGTMVMFKMSDLYEIYRIFNDSEWIEVTDEGLIISVPRGLLQWDPTKSLQEIESEAIEDRALLKYNLLEQHKRQERIYSALVQCSRELSEFINTHIPLDEALEIRRTSAKRKRES